MFSAFGAMIKREIVVLVTCLPKNSCKKSALFILAFYWVDNTIVCSSLRHYKLRYRQRLPFFELIFRLKFRHS